MAFPEGAEGVSWCKKPNWMVLTCLNKLILLFHRYCWNAQAKFPRATQNISKLITDWPFLSISNPTFINILLSKLFAPSRTLRRKIIAPLSSQSRFPTESIITNIYVYFFIVMTFIAAFSVSAGNAGSAGSECENMHNNFVHFFQQLRYKVIKESSDHLVSWWFLVSWSKLYF